MQRPLAAIVEPVQIPEGLEQRVLDEIVGIGDVAGPLREPAPRPALERGRVAGEEAVHGLAVAVGGQAEQCERRVVGISLHSEAGRHHTRRRSVSMAPRISTGTASLLATSWLPVA